MRGAERRRRPQAPSWSIFGRDALRGLRRVRADLARGQVGHAPVGEVGLADLCADEDAVIRGERAQVVRALAADFRLLVDVDRRRAGLLPGAAEPVGVLDCQYKRRVAVRGVDIGSENAGEHNLDGWPAAVAATRRLAL